MPNSRAITSLFIGTALLFPALAQNQPDKLQKDRARAILKDLADGIRKNYYDPAFHGVDINASAKAAEAELDKAKSIGDEFGIIAAVLDPLNDSHTFFDPPARNIRREYGYELTAIGDNIFVTAVRPGGPAAEKLNPGDQILAWEGYKPARNTLWKMNYSFNRLYSLPAHTFKVRGLDGAERTVQVAATQHAEKRILDLTGSNGDGDLWQLVREQENADHMNRQRTDDFGEKLLIWKMPQFDFTDEVVDKVLKDARKHAALVLDLRGNPGGYVKSLEYLVGGVMDHDVTIAKRVGRKPNLKPQLAKSRTSSAYSGKLIVLIDSHSASAAELLARVVQLEHRGTVLGDVSSGSVMESRYYDWKQGSDTQFFYGASITDADLIMSDGKSLEHAGVTPDELILPTPEDLSKGLDPVLARAAALADVKLDPAQAGRLFPIEWRKY